MLILLPASEAKTTGARGAPFDPTSLSFPELSPTRTAVLDALVTVSSSPDAARRLSVPATMIETVRGNATLREAPAVAVAELYSGPLYAGLDLATLDANSRRRARAWIVVISALWGALRLGDRVPSYRLNMCGRLPGLAHLPEVWRGPLDAALRETASRGVIVDCRSAEYVTAWRPPGALAERTVALKPVRGDDRRGLASHPAKLMRGLVVRRIITDGIDPRRPDGLAEALSRHFDVDLQPPRRAGQAFELRVVCSNE